MQTALTSHDWIIQVVAAASDEMGKLQSIEGLRLPDLIDEGVLTAARCVYAMSKGVTWKSGPVGAGGAAASG